MLQDRSVSLLLDVLEILRRAAIDRIVLAHVAQPSRVLRQALAVARFAFPFHREVRGFDELGAGQQRDAGGAEDFHGGQRANWSFDVAHAALRSTSRSRVAMSSGISAAPSP